MWFHIGFNKMNNAQKNQSVHIFHRLLKIFMEKLGQNYSI